MFKFPFSLFKVQGHSMEPKFSAGSLIITFNYGSYQVGDVILFEREGEILLKRIKQLKDSRIYVIGDNQVDSFDSTDFGWVEKSHLVGKVIGKLL